MSGYVLRIGLLWIAVARCFAGTVGFDQPLLNDADRGAFSQYNGQELADQFTLPTMFSIQKVTWYRSFWQTDLAPDAAQYPFVIRVFNTTSASEYGVVVHYSLDDPTTAIGTPFYELPALADVTPLGIPFTGTDSGGDSSDRITYQFAIDNLSGPVLQPSTEYWMSIAAVGPTGWRWGNSTVDSSDYSVYRSVSENGPDWTGFSNAPYNLQTRGNLAFTLDGAVVPEPSTSMDIIAVVILVLVSRRSSRRCVNDNQAECTSRSPADRHFIFSRRALRKKS
ncbi:MAG: hypothetical protein LAQ69_05340 [Acidobacteriia bacterium]|nr:hypothetical protein [Terriglobia bacterium]